MVYESLDSMSSFTALMRNINIAVTKTKEILEMPPMDIEGAEIVPEKRDIELKNVGFSYDRKWKDLTPEERQKKRSEQAKPVLDAILAWSKTRTAAPKSKLGIALNYLKNQWPTLTTYLQDGRIELSNNRAERSIKPFVISRKNFLFANTTNGAQSYAVLFSLIETAKENNLDPCRYLTWVLKEAPKRSCSDPDWAQTLTPQNAPPDCR